MQVIYADTLFLINLAVNYILLLLTARICAVYVPRLRLAAAAVSGAAYSVAAVLPGLGFLTALPVKIGFGILMSLAAFGGQERFIRATVVMFAVSASFGGVMTAISLAGGAHGYAIGAMDIKTLLLTFAVCYAVFSTVFRRAARIDSGQTVEVVMKMGSRSIKLKALIDTGNSLVEPISGKRVLIIGKREARELFGDSGRIFEKYNGENASEILETMDRRGGRSRLMLIPFSSIGSAGGMMPAFSPDEIKVDGKVRKDLIAAVSPNRVSDTGTFTALINI